jgi:ATP-dependent exoDNAse (exonuclease V) beta subunit
VITFVPDTHEYFDASGQRVPSVTQVLQAAGLIDFSGVPSAILLAAQARGTRVHKAAHYLTENALDWASVDESERGYVEACALFLSTAQFEVLGQERRLFHRVHRYAGTCDIIGWWGGRPAVADYKTGNPNDVAADIQLAAYAEALRSDLPIEWLDASATTPIERVSVRLFKDGRFSAELYPDSRDFSIFLACLTVMREQERRGVRGRKAA